LWHSNSFGPAGRVRLSREGGDFRAGTLVIEPAEDLYHGAGVEFPGGDTAMQIESVRVIGTLAERRKLIAAYELAFGIEFLGILASVVKLDERVGLVVRQGFVQPVFLPLFDDLRLEGNAQRIIDEQDIGFHNDKRTTAHVAR